MLIEVECTDHLQKTQAEITVLREKLRVSQQEIASLKSRVQEHQSHTDEQVAAAIHSMKAEHRVVVDALVREFETERRALALEGIKNAEMLSQAQLRFEAAVDLHVSVEEAHRRAVDMAGSNAVSMFLSCPPYGLCWPSIKQSNVLPGWTCWRCYAHGRWLPRIATLLLTSCHHWKNLSNVLHLRLCLFDRYCARLGQWCMRRMYRRWKAWRRRHGRNASCCSSSAFGAERVNRPFQ
eukprot:TRINITY_DN2330_c0_g1_i2.p1 TRINITY_DN2330_c0_g1~~TRINITY_DN2330_c0_g1_i2.p1  ORF type:complete len:237 (+),score=14.03 TRINITY_DN2330_c0_g1_i2:353-1063(+)